MFVGIILATIVFIFILSIKFIRKWWNEKLDEEKFSPEAKKVLRLLREKDWRTGLYYGWIHCMNYDGITINCMYGRYVNINSVELPLRWYEKSIIFDEASKIHRRLLDEKETTEKKVNEAVINRFLKE